MELHEYTFKRFFLSTILVLLLMGTTGGSALASNSRSIFTSQSGENLPPVADPGGPYTGFEGTFLSIDGSGSFDPEGGMLQFEWMIDTASYSGMVVDVFFDDDFSGDVVLTVTDPDGALGIGSASITVSNRNPIVEAFTNYIISVGDTLILQQVTFFDPGRADLHTATIDWDDGSPIEAGIVVETNGSGEIQGSHVFTQNSDFLVEVCVTDDDSGTGCDTFSVTVVGTPEPTATSTPTPSSTSTPIDTPSGTPTNTPIPETQCPGLRVTDPRFRDDNFRVDLTNDHPSETFTLTGVLLYWPHSAQTLDWMRFDQTIFWNGNDGNPPTNTNHEPHWIGGEVTVFEPGESRRFDVDFDHPGDLENFAEIDDFSGTTFLFAEGCSLKLGGEPKPTPTPYVPPEFPACPAGFDLLGQFTDQLRRDKEPMSHSYALTLDGDGTVWINGWVKEGHPERGCPGDPSCNQNQQHEDVVIEIDGEELGYYEDSDHGPDENAWYPSGPFEAPLDIGSHILTFRHSMHGSGPQSVNYLHSVCVRYGTNIYLPIILK